MKINDKKSKVETKYFPSRHAICIHFECQAEVFCIATHTVWESDAHSNTALDTESDFECECNPMLKEAY